MKLLNIKSIITSSWTPCLIGFPLAVSAFAASEKLWVARPTGAVQCSAFTSPSQEGESVTRLGESVTQLESDSLAVKEAKVGRLSNKNTCDGCGCPNGTYNLVQIENSATAREVAVRDGWEMIDSQTIRVDE